MKHTFDFGKVDFLGIGRRTCPVTVEVRLEEETTGFGKTYYQLSACGEIWNNRKTDIYVGGQCLDTIKEFVKDNALFDEIFGIWNRYHLNGLNAGTPTQTDAVREYLKDGKPYNYSDVCNYLKEKGLYEVSFTGVGHSKEYNNDPYVYGTDWIVEELPEDVVSRLKELCEEK